MERPVSGPDASRAIVVRSSVLPPRGLSGLVRRAAYRVPDHRPRHWMLLLLADRIDVAESALRRPLLWLLGLGLLGGGVAAWRRYRAA